MKVGDDDFNTYVICNDKFDKEMFKNGMKIKTRDNELMYFNSYLFSEKEIFNIDDFRPDLTCKLYHRTSDIMEISLNGKVLWERDTKKERVNGYYKIILDDLTIFKKNKDYNFLIAIKKKIENILGSELGGFN